MTVANEQIKFMYTFTDKDSGKTHEVVSTAEKDAILDSEVCEMFVDFMRSVGYSEENIWNYFKE